MKPHDITIQLIEVSAKPNGSVFIIIILKIIIFLSQIKIHRPNNHQTRPPRRGERRDFKHPGQNGSARRRTRRTEVAKSGRNPDDDRQASGSGAARDGIRKGKREQKIK